jgi:purine-binding chemotaxis protein CheW
MKDRPTTGRPLRRETESALAGYAPFTSGEFLAFHLGNEEYCIEILKVLEIRSHQAVTRIANAPAHLTGMIDLRGAIVPVVDLRLLFGMKAAVVSSSTVTIVLNILGRTVGMVVDSVSDVVELSSGSIKQARLPAAVIAASGIAGIATAYDRVLVVLDIEALFRNPKVGLMN